MHKKRLAVVAGAVGAISFSLITATPALADYAPSTTDVVGVGSDTVQSAMNFVADGDYVSDTGYNLNQRNRVANFDATADAGARLAYGTFGATSATCSPGTGGTAGTGNQTAVHADKPCVLNPEIVLRAGLRPTQRPNGSGAGYTALKADDAAGTHNID